MATLTLFIIISLVIIVNVKAIIKVPFDQVFIIERLGKYHKLMHHGYNIIIPIIDTIRSKVYIGEQLLDIPECSCFTKDNKQINAKLCVTYCITDPVKATYEIDSLDRGLMYVTETALRDIFEKITLSDALNSKDSIIEQVSKVLTEASDKWGYAIQNIEITKLYEYSKEIPKERISYDEPKEIISNSFDAIKEYK